ncbi:MAG TPA: hypothetical protein VF665_24230 [Longimicrobium sp.]|uniref:hypothetical protein n=1 Tax=Longimicrobium sp. TaxID=2029185 RepID=UPI002ED9CA8F
MKMRTLAATLALAPLVACSGAATTSGTTSTPAPSGGSDPVVSQLLAAASELAGQRGYTPSSTRPTTGRLNNGTQQDVNVTLNQGREYLVIGMCDRGCSDVDLQLFDASGTKVSEDVMDDDVPILEFRAASSGSYRMRVVMARCTTEPCAYGVSVYSK